jgi:hypothetical protein
VSATASPLISMLSLSVLPVPLSVMCTEEATPASAPLSVMT